MGTDQRALATADPAQDSHQGCQELWQGRLTVCHGQKILEIVIQSPCFTVGETGSEGRGLAQGREVAEPGRPGSAAAPDFSLIQLTSPSSAVEIAGTQGTLRIAGSTHTCGRNLGRRILIFVEAPLKMGPPTGPGPGFLKPGGGPQSEEAQEVVPGELGSPAA